MKGDQLINEAARTRSQKKVNPDQWTTVPLLVKIFKLLVGELSDHLENALASAQDIDDEDSDGAEEWVDDANGGDAAAAAEFPSNRQGTELSRLLGLNGTFDLDDQDEEGEEDDPDALADPLFRINLRQYLTEFIGEFTKQPYFISHFAQHLNLLEKKTLSNVGVQFEQL